MKRFLAILLALTLMLSLGVTAHADQTPAGPGNDDIRQQLTLIAASFKDLKQTDGEEPWYYAVTDLDHNRRLELLAVNSKGPKLKAWELSPDGKSLVPCRLPQIPAPLVEGGEELIKDGFGVDLRADSVDTYYDVLSDTFYYVFVNVSEISTFGDASTGEVTSVVSGSTVTAVNGVSFKNGFFNAGNLAICVSYDVGDGILRVICRGVNGENLTQPEFLAFPAATFAGMSRFATAFDWFTADEATTLHRFADSYAVFDGTLDPDGGEGGIALMSSQSYSGVYITKNPTDEKHNPGETAEFIANANVYDDVTWTFVAPDGRTYNEQEFVRMCGGIPEGTKTGDLKIKNVNTDMNGWGVFAMFDYRGATAKTSTAYFYVWQGASSAQQNSNLAAVIDNFYYTKPYLDYVWGCPLCGASVVGTNYCTSCGFNPYAFYYNYYGIPLEDAGSYYVGDQLNTPLAALIPAPVDTIYSWSCPVCGQNNRGNDACWNCNYHYGDPVKVQPSLFWEETAPEMRQCEVCGGWFNNDFDRCPYCGTEPDDHHQNLTARACQYCGQYFNSDFDVCPYCGNEPYDGYDYSSPASEIFFWTCPVCGDGNQDVWTCGVCGYVYGSPVVDPQSQISTQTYVEYMQGADLRQCEYCGEYFNADYDVCPYCGGMPNDGYSYGYDGDGDFLGYTPGGCARYRRFDAFGKEYVAVVCPVCGYEHSMATNCPKCGSGYT